MDIIALETKKSKIPKRAVMKKGIIPDHPAVTIFNGSVGSGKTMLLMNLLTRKEFYGKKREDGGCYFNRIIVFAPTVHSDDLYDQLESVKDEDKHEHLEPDDLQAIIDKQKEKIEKTGIDKSDRILFIFEDVQSRPKFLKSKPFRECVFAGRHLNSSSWIVGQSFTRTPRYIRLQANYVFYFQGTASENKIIAEEYGVLGLNQREMSEIIKHATKDRYSFLFINRKCDQHDRFRKCLGEILRVKG